MILNEKASTKSLNLWMNGQMQGLNKNSLSITYLNILHVQIPGEWMHSSSENPQTGLSTGFPLGHTILTALMGVYCMVDPWKCPTACQFIQNKNVAAIHVFIYIPYYNINFHNISSIWHICYRETSVVAVINTVIT